MCLLLVESSVRARDCANLRSQKIDHQTHDSHFFTRSQAPILSDPEDIRTISGVFGITEQIRIRILELSELR